MIKKVDISPEVADVLRRGEWAGWLYRLPEGQLERPLYLAVDKVLRALGGQWHKGHRGHMFSSEAKTAMVAALEQGHVVDQKRTLEQFFTPDELAERGADALNIKPKMMLLEPSAGSGRLVVAALARGAAVVAIEIDPVLAAGLLAEHNFKSEIRVIEADFMSWREGSQSYAGFPIERVLMNPPFSRNQDIAHVTKAFGHLAPGGRLVAIMSPHFTFADDRPSREFRALIGYPAAELPASTTCFSGGLLADASVELLAAGAFKAEGTNVASVLVVIDKARDVHGFDEDHSPGSRSREGRSIPHSYGGEGRNFVD